MGRGGGLEASVTVGDIQLERKFPDLMIGAKGNFKMRRKKKLGVGDVSVFLPSWLSRSGSIDWLLVTNIPLSHIFCRQL